MTTTHVGKALLIDAIETVGTEEVKVSIDEKGTILIDAYEPAPDPFVGDLSHPDWADYVATNLRDALGQVPDTGDWHGALRSWCERTATGRLKPNRSDATPSDETEPA